MLSSHEQIWILFVRVGLVPEAPVCKRCSRPLNVEKSMAKLHFSVMCWKCKKATDLMAETPLFEVKQYRKFLAVLQGR